MQNKENTSRRNFLKKSSLAGVGLLRRGRCPHRPQSGKKISNKLLEFSTHK
jgi:hypothetical protein